MAKTHYHQEDKVHYLWDNEIEPTLTVEAGDTVVYQTREVSDGQITPDSNRRRPGDLQLGPHLPFSWPRRNGER